MLFPKLSERHLSDLCQNATPLEKFKTCPLASSFSVSTRPFPFFVACSQTFLVCLPQRDVGSPGGQEHCLVHTQFSAWPPAGASSIFVDHWNTTPRVNKLASTGCLGLGLWLFRHLWGGLAVESCEKQGTGCCAVQGAQAYPPKDPLGFFLPPLVRQQRDCVPIAPKVWGGGVTCVMWAVIGKAGVNKFLVT